MKRLLVVLFAIGLVACESENLVVAPKAPEVDPQFVLERRMMSNVMPNIYVFRDKVNGKLIYVTPGAGIAVEDE